MAGFILYSLDWSKVETFLSSPPADDVQRLAELVSDGLDEIDNAIDDDDPLASWPSDPAELVPVVSAHLTKPDWYADFYDPGKAMWESAFVNLCDERFGFACESDGVYWDIHSETLKHHRQKIDVIGDLEVTHFGHRPFRFLYQGKLRYDDWYPYHSMHTPAEVAKLKEQFSAAKDRLLSAKIPGVQEDYEELMPVLQKLIDEQRVLYVSVDT